MGQAVLEDRARSAAIWDAYRKPGATLASVGAAFDISIGRVGRIVKREQAREQRAYDRRKSVPA
jgi:hypothetical protein